MFVFFLVSIPLWGFSFLNFWNFWNLLFGIALRCLFGIHGNFVNNQLHGINKYMSIWTQRVHVVLLLLLLLLLLFGFSSLFLFLVSLKCFLPLFCSQVQRHFGKVFCFLFVVHFSLFLSLFTLLLLLLLCLLRFHIGSVLFMVFPSFRF